MSDDAGTVTNVMQQSPRRARKPWATPCLEIKDVDAVTQDGLSRAGADALTFRS